MCLCVCLSNCPSVCLLNLHILDFVSRTTGSVSIKKKYLLKGIKISQMDCALFQRDMNKNKLYIIGVFWKYFLRIKLTIIAAKTCAEECKDKVNLKLLKSGFPGVRLSYYGVKFLLKKYHSKKKTPKKQ